MHATDRIAAGLVDDDPVGEGFIVGLDVKSPLLSVQCVFLDEVDVVHARNLPTAQTHLVSQKGYVGVRHRNETET